MTIAGCAPKAVQYGSENLRYAPAYFPKSIAVAPTVNLSGQRHVDPLLQADLVYRELQTIRGPTIVPVNRTAQAMIALNMDAINTTQDAFAVCDAIGVDALAVATITLFDPYDPPKLGASVQLFVRNQPRARSIGLDLQALRRGSKETQVQSEASNVDFIQVVGMFDASNGSVRNRINAYAQGRVEPLGPLGEREIYLHMDRYCGFVWSELIDQLLSKTSE